MIISNNLLGYSRSKIGVRPEQKNQIVSFKQNPASTALKVSEALFEFSRVIKNGSECVTQPCEKCCEVIASKARGFVENDKPIELILPAFPYKSISPQKVLSSHADMAENNCMALFKNIIDKIQKIYKNGAQIKIYTDGYPIAPIDSVPDEVIKRYIDEIQDFSQKNGLGDRFKLISLKDVYGSDLNNARKTLLNDFGKTLDEIRQQVTSDPLMNSDYCGIKRFITEEQNALHPGISTNQMNKLSRQMAYETIQYDDAWSKLMESNEHGAVRLSCHPQPCGARKTGIRLSDTCNNWITPWHSSAVRVEDAKYVLMKRAQAHELGLKVIKDNKHNPSHFELPSGLCTNDRESLISQILDISPLIHTK